MKKIKLSRVLIAIGLILFMFPDKYAIKSLGMLNGSAWTDQVNYSSLYFNSSTVVLSDFDGPVFNKFSNRIYRQEKNYKQISSNRINIDGVEYEMSNAYGYLMLQSEGHHPYIFNTYHSQVKLPFMIISIILCSVGIYKLFVENKKKQTTGKNFS